MLDELHTQKMASLAYLIPGIAHELNNPTSFVYANMDHLERYVGRLRKRFEEEELRAEKRKDAEGVDALFETLDRVVRGTRQGAARMKRIVEELRTSSRKGCSERTKQTRLIQPEEMTSTEQLVRDVADKLNDPVNVVYSNICLLERHVEELKGIARESPEWDVEEDRTFRTLDRLIASCRNGTDRMRRIVEDLRRFSQEDKAELREVDIREEVESTLMLLTSLYKNRITVHREYGDVPEIGCYGGQFGQVLMNLLINAAQAISDEGDVWISTRAEDDEAILTIRDNGRGIASEDLDHIFDPFFTTKGPEEGTGLGLGISWNIVERHGGEIEVESEVGKGTRFTVRLPVGVGRKA